MTSAAAYGGRDRVSAERLLRREGHPLGVRRYYADPADEEVDAAATSRKWTFGVAAGALLVAGTFAAGALGLNGGSVPFAGENAPEHAPSAPGGGPGGGPGDIGTPAVAAPPHGDRDDNGQPAKESLGSRGGATGGVTGGEQSGRPGGAGGGSGATGGSADSERGAGGGPATPAPAPQPAPATPAPQPGGQAGPVEQVVTPVTDTVGNVTEPVTDTVGGILSPVTGTLSGGGEQPAMTMIDPLGDLLG